MDFYLITKHVSYVNWFDFRNVEVLFVQKCKCKNNNNFFKHILLEKLFSKNKFVFMGRKMVSKVKLKLVIKKKMFHI